MKRLLAVLIIFLLVGCSKKESLYNLKIEYV